MAPAHSVNVAAVAGIAIETLHHVVQDHSEKRMAVLLHLTENLRLLFGRQLEKRFAEFAAAGLVQFDDSLAISFLMQFMMLGQLEVDEVGYSGLSGSRVLILWNDLFGDSLDRFSPRGP